jgi:acetyl-CoA carboxylase beta subunit
MKKEQILVENLIKRCSKCKNYYYADYFCEKCGLCLDCCKCGTKITPDSWTNFFIEE